MIEMTEDLDRLASLQRLRLAMAKAGDRREQEHEAARRKIVDRLGALMAEAKARDGVPASVSTRDIETERSENNVIQFVPREEG